MEPYKILIILGIYCYVYLCVCVCVCIYIFIFYYKMAIYITLLHVSLEYSSFYCHFNFIEDTNKTQRANMVLLLFYYHFTYFLKLLLSFFFYFTILYWFCYTSTWIHHEWILNPLPSPSLYHPSGSSQFLKDQ